MIQVLYLSRNGQHPIQYHFHRHWPQIATYSTYGEENKARLPPQHALCDPHGAHTRDGCRGLPIGSQRWRRDSPGPCNIQCPGLPGLPSKTETCLLAEKSKTQEKKLPAHTKSSFIASATFCNHLQPTIIHIHYPLALAPRGHIWGKKHALFRSTESVWLRGTLLLLPCCKGKRMM